MADLEFFFDPMCPWAWITSRWVVEVRDRRALDVHWRFISLSQLNAETLDRADAARAAGEDTDVPEQYRGIATTGARLLRVAAAARDRSGNDAVDRVYTAAGELLHTQGRSRAFWRGGDAGDLVGDTLAAAGLPAGWAEAADDDRWDAVVHEETELALKRTGPDVGTPIITWDVDRPDEATMFGPVISRIPRGDEALRLWDAMAVVARTPGMAEFKRSLRSEPQFG